MTSKTKTVSLGEVFTAAELEAAAKLYNECKASTTRFNPLCIEQIVQPALARINQVTGQENDPVYWAYMVEYALMKARQR